MVLFTCPKERPSSAQEIDLAATIRDFHHDTAFEELVLLQRILVILYLLNVSITSWALYPWLLKLNLGTSFTASITWDQHKWFPNKWADTEAQDALASFEGVGNPPR